MKRTHGPNAYPPHPPDCYGCKVLTIQFGDVPFQAHYNYAVGAYVTNQRDFNDRLKRLGDDQSERTGISSTYEPIHPSDLRHSPPPEAPPDHLPRLVAHDEHGHPMHDPVDGLPTHPSRPNSRARALLEAETSDLIGPDDAD